MISHLLLEHIPEGSIPVYEIQPAFGLHYRVHVDRWQEEWRAEPRPEDGPQNLFLPVSIDTTVLKFERLIHRLIAEAEAFTHYDQCDSAIVFALQSGQLTSEGNTPEPDALHFGHYMLAGMACLPSTVGIGSPLNGENPADIIFKLCRGERDHPIIGASYQEVTRRRERIRRRTAERLRQERVASMRALRLLRDCLTAEQIQELKRFKHFHVRAPNGELFRIEKKSQHNVFQVVEGRDAVEYCIVSQHEVPIYDLMLAQKYMIETDLREFKRIANQWELVDGKRNRTFNFDLSPDDEAEFQAALAQTLEMARAG